MGADLLVNSTFAPLSQTFVLRIGQVEVGNVFGAVAGRVLLTELTVDDLGPLRIPVAVWCSGLLSRHLLPAPGTCANRIDDELVVERLLGTAKVVLDPNLLSTKGQALKRLRLSVGRRDSLSGQLGAFLSFFTRLWAFRLGAQSPTVAGSDGASFRVLLCRRFPRFHKRLSNTR
jgi:hypothetical protein